jgi:hypothetical protein
VLVPNDVCVATKASLGMGAVQIFDRDGGGIDVNWNDSRRAPANTPRLVLDGDVGVGFLEVRHNRVDHNGHRFDGLSDLERNSACATNG